MKKEIMKKTISLTLAIAMIMSFALTAVAAAPTIEKAEINQARTVIELTMLDTAELEEGVDLASQITLKKDSSTATALPYGSTAVLDGKKIEIRLTSSLNAKNVVVMIAAGTFKGQQASIKSPSFDAKGPSDVSEVTLDRAKQVITIKFDAAIDGDVADGDITLSRNGGSFSEKISSSQVSIDGSAIKITLENPLSGENNKVKISAGVITYSASGNINLEDIITPAISATKIIPKFNASTGFKLDEDLSTITFTFDKNIYFASEEVENNIRRNITISRNNEGHVALGANDYVTISGKKLIIELNYPVEGSVNQIKIKKNTLAGENGDLIEQDVVSPDFGIKDLEDSAPTYKSVGYNKAKKQVSIKFSEAIYVASMNVLRASIEISRNKGDYQSLSVNDTVEIYGEDTILITLDQGLTGEGNRFRILPDTIRGEDGKYQVVTQTTGYVYIDDESYEDFEAEINVSADMKTVDIVFDRYIESNYPYDSTLDYLKSEIKIHRNVGYDSLTANDHISINGRTLRIVFQREISETDIIRVGKLALKDSYGIIMSNDLEVSIAGNATKEILDPDDGVTISADKRTVTIGFEQRVYNNMSSISSLKKMIRIAYNGVDFEELEDDVQFEFAETGIMTITFPRAITEPDACIKILAGALQDARGETITDEIITNPLGRIAENTKVTIEGSRVYIGAEEENTNAYGNKIYTMVIDDSKAADAIDDMRSGAIFKVLFPDFSYSSTLEMSCATLQSLIGKNATIMVESAGAVHIFEANELQLEEALENLQAYETNTTVEFGISRVEAPYSTDFEQKAQAKSFTILTPATEFTLLYTSDGKNYAVTKFEDYVQKHFEINPLMIQGQELTIVRIENSGKINPVPTTKTTSGDAVYLVGKVKSNGVYGVIAASRSFTDTPAWATTAVNTLASRMILQNASGGPCRAQDAVSRAEVAEMVTRTLGLLTDKSGASSFFDVSPTDWYFSSTAIAVENDLIRGYGDGTFGSERNITRQEVMTIMARVMEYLGSTENKDMTMEEAEETLAKFKDADKVADWAKINMAKCVAADVVRGDDKMFLNPNAHLTRAEMSQLIYNLMVNYGLMG